MNKRNANCLLALFFMFLVACQGGIPQNAKVEIKEKKSFTISKSNIIDSHHNVWDSRLFDFDNDGNLDLVSVSKDEKVFFVFDILGQKKTILKKTKCIHPVSLAIADFNNDGKIELILITESGLHTYMTIDKGQIVEHPINVLRKTNQKGRLWRGHKVALSWAKRAPALVAGGYELYFFENKGNMQFVQKKIKIEEDRDSNLNINLNKKPSDWLHAYRWITPVEDFNNDGTQEILALDYPDRTVWLLVSHKKEPSIYKAKKLCQLQYCPLWGELLNKDPVPKWLIMTDVPGKIWLIKGGLGQPVSYRPILEIPNRIAGAALAELNGDNCKDLIIFAENLVPRENGSIIIYHGICQENRYNLKKIKVLRSSLMSTYALKYVDPILVVPGFERKKTEIFIKGRDF